jgi:uncharacterized protein with GYD domain
VTLNDQAQKEGSDEEQSVDGGDEEAETTQKSGVPIIKIDFALGDFDGTAIAEAEQDSDDDKACPESVEHP